MDLSSWKDFYYKICNSYKRFCHIFCHITPSNITSHKPNDKEQSHLRTEDGATAVGGQLPRMHQFLCSIPELNKTKQSQTKHQKQTNKTNPYLSCNFRIFLCPQNVSLHVMLDLKNWPCTREAEAGRFLSSRTARAIQRNPVSKNQKKKKKIFFFLAKLGLERWLSSF